MLGGCTVLVSLFILGKLYVANAGDSRGCLCRSGGIAYPMSYDFTPITERQRLQQLGYQKPHLLGAEYTHIDFFGRKPGHSDLGKAYSNFPAIFSRQVVFSIMTSHSK